MQLTVVGILILGDIASRVGADRVRGIVAILHDVGVHAVDLAGHIIAKGTDTRVDAVKHAVDGLVVEARLKLGTGRRGATAAIAIAVASAERAVASPAEQQGQQDDPPAITVAETVVAVPAGDCRNVGGAEVIRSEYDSSSLCCFVGCYLFP